MRNKAEFDQPAGPARRSLVTRLNEPSVLSDRVQVASLLDYTERTGAYMLVERGEEIEMVRHSRILS